MTFYLFNNHLKLKGTWLRYQRFCCVCLFLPDNINIMCIQQLRGMVSPPSHNTVGICKQTTLLILYFISSKLVTLFKVIDAPIQVSNIFYLTVNFRFLKFSFRISFLLFPNKQQDNRLQIEINLIYFLATLFKYYACTMPDQESVSYD